MQIVLLLGHITVDEISIIFRDKLGTRKGILLPQDIMKYILLHNTMAGVKKNAWNGLQYEGGFKTDHIRWVQNGFDVFRYILAGGIGNKFFYVKTFFQKPPKFIITSKKLMLNFTDAWKCIIHAWILFEVSLFFFYPFLFVSKMRLKNFEFLTSFGTSWHAMIELTLAASTIVISTRYSERTQRNEDWIKPQHVLWSYCTTCTFCGL